MTHWGGQFYGAPYAVVMEKGFFRQHGVDITGILTASGGGTAVRNTLAGGLPFGEVSLAAAVQAIGASQKLVIVAAGAQSVSDQLWAVKQGSPLHGIEDLAGKRIAYTAPGSVSSGAVDAAFLGEMTLSQNAALVQPVFYVRDVMSQRMMQTVLITTAETPARMRTPSAA